MSTVLTKSSHQHRVESFMLRAKQAVPVVPSEPSPEVRILRAKLILEEALETITKGLGVSIVMSSHKHRSDGTKHLVDADMYYYADDKFDLVETIDGCCDIKVVTTGTLSACGVPDNLFQELIDENNLQKFAPGHTWREDGKLIKPPNHQPPAIQDWLRIVHSMSVPKAANHLTNLAADVEDSNPYLVTEARRHATTPSTPPATPGASDQQVYSSERP